MARKIDTNRLYKLVKGVILTISGFFLLMGGVYLFNYNSISDRARDGMYDCLKPFPRLVDSMGICDYFMDEVRGVTKLIWIGLIVGLGLPIIFFTVNATINYVAPNKKSTVN
ncbi:MAG: hypothetical protein ABIJ03_01585 [Patescibacteria group bacterium]